MKIQILRITWSAQNSRCHWRFTLHNNINCTGW